MQDNRIHRFLEQLGVAIAGSVRDEIRDHEDRMHLPTRRPRPLGAVPYPEGSIPDTVLARMVELLDTIETQDFGITLVARIFGYPETLVLRELAGYKARLDSLDDRANLA